VEVRRWMMKERKKRFKNELNLAKVQSMELAKEAENLAKEGQHLVKGQTKNYIYNTKF